MTDIFLRAGEANPSDVKLRDPTLADVGGSHQIEPVGVASSSALGQIGLNGTIAAVGVASVAALGDVGLNGTVAAAGILSDGQVGRASCRERVSKQV